MGSEHFPILLVFFKALLAFIFKKLPQHRNYIFTFLRQRIVLTSKLLIFLLQLPPLKSDIGVQRYLGVFKNKKLHKIVRKGKQK